MKKGTQIKVTESAQYNGRDMDWTETFTGKKVIGNGGEIVFHRSDVEIKSFKAKEICVSPFEHGKTYLESNATLLEVQNKYNWKKYIYAIYLPEGTEVDTYSGDEYRFELTKNMKVVFVGTVYEAKKGTNRIMTGSGLKEITTYIQFSDTIKL